MKRLLSAALSGIIIASSIAGCTPADRTDTVYSTSGALSVYADWLTNRLETDERLTEDTEIIIGNSDTAETYGIDVSALSDEGFIIRRTAESDTTLIFAKTDDGVDRGVRYFANYCPDDGELNIVKDEGYRIGKITIAGADLSEYVIVNTEPDNENMSFTAEELREHLGNACGVYPEIVTDAADDAYAITLVRDAEGDTYGDENFNIKSHDHGITITGGRYRGCMYGMYTLLEDYVGIRFYYKSDAVPDRGDYGQAYIYEADEIVIEADEIDRTEEGSIFSRCGYSDKPFFSPALKYNGNMYDKPGADYAYTGLYGTYGVAGNVTHGMHQYFLYDDFSEWDPNYVKGRNPCFTNEDLFDETYRRVIADLDHRVNVDGFAPMMERYMCCIDIAHIDSPEFCWCEDCMAVYVEDGAVSGAIIRFANKMVEALSDTPYSDIYVGCFAYYGTTKPPKVTKPDEKVIVNFCFYISDDKKTIICANHSFNDPECKKNKHFTELYDQWCEISANTYIWYYPTTAYYFANTTQDLFKIYGDIQYLAESGTYGIMALQDNDPTGLAFIKNYMIQRMMWDADMSYDEYIGLLKEFLFLNYGDGYESVYDYLLIMDNASNMTGNCWAGIIDAPMHKMNFSYIKENSDLILEMYENAKKLALDSYQEMMVDEIFKFSRYHIAIANHTDMWLNGNDESRAAYKENLDTFVARYAGTVLFLDWGAYPWRYVPAAGTFDYDVNPIEWMREKALTGWDEDYNY